MAQAGGAAWHTTPRSGGSGGTNNLSPILFHHVHGISISISRDGTVAKREHRLGNGVTFSNRPVMVAEKVCVKFLEVSKDFFRVIRFGFTSNDPGNLRYGLLKYVNLDMKCKPVFWTMKLPLEFANRDNVFFYYVTQAGDVHFGINDVEKGAFNCDVDVTKPLWAIIDLYGISTAIDLLDPRQQLNNSRHNLAIGDDTNPGDPVNMGRLILPSLAALTINQQNHQQPQSQRSAIGDATINDMPGSSLQQPGNFFNHLQFHTTHGRNIRLSNDRCIASRADTEFLHAYVFTARPIQLGVKVIIQVLATIPKDVGALAFSLTSCNPAMFQEADLPYDSLYLLDQPENWVIRNNVASCPQRGDELSFCVTHTGEVQFSKNGSTPVVFMHVDQTKQLWAFFDMYGNIEKIRILGSCVETHHPHTASVSRNSSPPQAVIDPDLAAGYLHVNMPCSVTNQSPPPAETTQQHLQSSQTSVPVDLQPSLSGKLLSNYRHTYIEPVSATSYSTPYSTVRTQQCVDATAATGGSGTECTVCCERPIDSLLYKCGHMSMCYKCAVEQWKGKGYGQCPLCRAVIRDVVRAYKSR